MKYRNIWIVILIAGLLFVGALAFGLVGLTPATAEAQTDVENIANLPRTITVVGEGTVNIEPDTAQVNIGVEIVEPDLQVANSQATQTIHAIGTALKDQGIADQNMQTSGLNIWIERPFSPEGAPSDRILYHVSNQVNVTIRDLTKIATILDSAIQAGANSMYGITFKVADPNALESDARSQAMDDARLKAEELAQLANVKLGEIVSVSEVVGSGGSGTYNSFQAFAAEGLGGGGGPVSPGELQMKMQLQVVFNVQ